MLSLFAERLHIVLSRASINVLKTKGRFRPRASILTDARLPEGASVSPERFAEILDTILTQANCPGLPASFVLSDELVRLFMVTPPNNPRSLQDCRAAAAMRFQSLFDETPSNWEVTGDWDLRHPFLACAVPRALLADLRRACEKHKLKLVAVMPQFVWEANTRQKALAPDAWLGVMQDGAMTLGAVNQNRLQAIRGIPLPENACDSEDWLAELVAREALRLNLPMPATIQLCGKVPGNWARQKQGALDCIRLDKRMPLPALPSLAPGTKLAATGGPG